MYSKEMKGRPISTISGAGGLSVTSRNAQSKEGYRNGGGDQYHHHSQSNHDEKGSDFTMNYGNYGDPYSFIPYQLCLLLADFVFNWSMDLVHESPLAVLIIFVFQSLAIIINLILYIMASASQTMQLGSQRRVNVHHWLNLFICLSYMILTGWWFIWALQKSWPSVSDQFSFTWSKFPNGSAVDTSTLAPPSLSLNKNNVTTGPAIVHQIKEHFTLWSPGFNSVYVIQRTLAIVYYFIYLRASFMVLNSQKIDAFIYMKRELVRRLREEKKVGRSSRKKGKWSGSASNHIPITSKMDLGLDGSGFPIDKEASSGTSRSKRPKKQMSVSWTDESKAEKKESTTSQYSLHGGGDLAKAESPSIKKLVKDRHRKKRLDEDRSENETNGDGHGESENGKISSVPPKPQPRPRSSRQERQKRAGADSVEEWNGEDD